jgi:hypothetical protein
MKRIWIYGIAIIAIMIAAGGIYLGTRSSGSNASWTGSNVFGGRIVNGSKDVQTYTNVSVLTDEGCTTDPRTGLANCTTKLQTKSGIIAFNYEHDMMEKPCLSIGDKADVRVLENSTAMVRRTYWAGGGA